MGFERQDIATEKISESQLAALKNLAGSYEALFSRRAIQFREMGLKDKNLAESDFRKLILSDYTFLKRPVFLIKDRIFVGSEKKTIEELENFLKKEACL